MRWRPRRGTQELRERAVRLYRESSRPPTFRRLGGQLNVRDAALRNWVCQYEADRGERDGRPSTDTHSGDDAGGGLAGGLAGTSVA